jgi:hypothetical protein
VKSRTGLVWRPSPGLCLLLASWVGLGLMLAWGFQEPRLDRVQRVLDAIEIDPSTALDTKGEKLLDDALGRYPGLGPGLSNRAPAAILEPSDDGLARLQDFHLVVLPGGPHQLFFEALSAVRVQVADRDLALAPGARAPVDLPVSPRARLVPVHVIDPANPGIRLIAVAENLAPEDSEREEVDP